MITSKSKKYLQHKPSKLIHETIQSRNTANKTEIKAKRRSRFQYSIREYHITNISFILAKKKNKNRGSFVNIQSSYYITRLSGVPEVTRSMHTLNKDEALNEKDV